MAYTLTMANEMIGRMSTGVMFPLSSDAWFAFGERRAVTDYGLIGHWIDFVHPVSEEKSTSQATEFIPSEWEIESSFIPRTTLGKRLLTLRTKAIDAGMRLLAEEEVLEEVKRRRGELGDEEADLY